MMEGTPQINSLPPSLFLTLAVSKCVYIYRSDDAEDDEHIGRLSEEWRGWTWRGFWWLWRRQGWWWCLWNRPWQPSMWWVGAKAGMTPLTSTPGLPLRPSRLETNLVSFSYLHSEISPLIRFEIKILIRNEKFQTTLSDPSRFPRCHLNVLGM